MLRYIVAILVATSSTFLARYLYPDAHIAVWAIGYFAGFIAAHIVILSHQ